MMRMVRHAFDWPLRLEGEKYELVVRQNMTRKNEAGFLAGSLHLGGRPGRGWPEFARQQSDSTN